MQTIFANLDQWSTSKIVTTTVSDSNNCLFIFSNIFLVYQDGQLSYHTVLYSH